MLSFDRGYLAFLDLGLGTAALQQMAGRDINNRRKVKRELLRRYALLSLVGIGIVILSARLLLGSLDSTVNFEDPKTIALCFALRLPFDMARMAHSVDLESQSRFLPLRLIDLLGQASWVIFAILAAANDYLVTTGAKVYLLVGVAQFVGSTLVTRERLPGGSWRNKTKAADIRPDLWTNGKWVALQRANGVIYTNMDRFILVSLVGFASVGEYDIPYKFQALGVLMLSLMPSAIFPVAASYARDGADGDLGELFTRGTRMTIAACIPPLLSLIFVTNDLISLWVGNQFLYLATSVRLFTSWTFLAVFHVVGITMLTAVGRNRAVFLLSLSSTVINLPVSIVLGQRWGINGVILGTLLSYLGVFFPYLFAELRTFSVSTSDWIRSIALPNLAPTLTQAAFALPMLHLMNGMPSVMRCIIVGGGGCAAFWLVYFFITGPQQDRSLLRGLQTRSPKR